MYYYFVRKIKLLLCDGNKEEEKKILINETNEQIRETKEVYLDVIIIKKKYSASKTDLVYCGWMRVCLFV